MSGDAIRVHYYEGDNLRFLSGKLIEETEEFIKVEMRNYIVTIKKEYIVKMESPKPWRS